MSNIQNNEKLIFLIKIVEKKWLNSLIDKGQIYMNTLKNYRNIENNEYNKVVGDSFEASETKQKEGYFKITDKYFQIHGSKSGHNVRISANQCAFCVYGVCTNNSDKINNNQYIHRLPWVVINKFCNDKVNEYAILIYTSPDELVKKIHFCAKSMNLYAGYGFITYDDYDYIPQFESRTVENNLEVCFHKRKIYNYQNEFRIVVLNNQDKPLEELCIGKLEDDMYESFSIEKSKDFIIEFSINKEVCNDMFSVDSVFYFSQ